jgi:hypothetical protein
MTMDTAEKLRSVIQQEYKILSEYKKIQSENIPGN